ncbi:TPA: hypothetical protein LZ306_003356 [Enterobacter bugandensis]|uniref:hypothetical protein n=1 Tax=Enterobacter TaxID=547 RepID=UPI00298470F4|nr:hypothetical protein [Enterobacter bugandensis]HBM7621101.1 hypothetical protein [Enterobacter bugandensis]HCK7257402.1 hypothetical protein [Enterobacter bugandensis]HCK7307135.1 hypothetical protein [Enterobacter bugandensis]HCK7320843.1 hypothetical protein [Enterobacter bugandensis]
MKEFKGSKQEWVRDGRMVYALEDGENRFYAGFAPGRNCLKGEAEANAQLAMAAPDLLEALQNMVTAYEHEASIDNPALLAARAAISKALGEG